MHKEHQGFLYGILSALCGAVMIVFVKLADQVPMIAIVFFRFVLGLILLLPWFIKHKSKFTLEHLPTHLVRDLSGIAAIFCYYYSVQYIPLVNAITLNNSSPLFVPLVIFVFLKLVVPKQRIVALFVGFLGVIVILRPTSHLTEYANLLALASALFAAIAYIYVRKLSRVESTATILFSYFIIASICCLFPTLYLWTPIQEPMIWLYLLAVGISGAFYQIFLTKALTHTPASKVSMVNYLSVVFGGFFGWLIWNETPSPWDFIGVGLIILGGIIALLDKEVPRKLK